MFPMLSALARDLRVVEAGTWNWRPRGQMVAERGASIASKTFFVVVFAQGFVALYLQNPLNEH